MSPVTIVKGSGGVPVFITYTIPISTLVPKLGEFFTKRLTDPGTPSVQPLRS